MLCMQAAEQIVVLEQGRVKVSVTGLSGFASLQCAALQGHNDFKVALQEVGNHQELLHRNGVYADLVSSQSLSLTASV